MGKKSGLWSQEGNVPDVGKFGHHAGLDGSEGVITGAGLGGGTGSVCDGGVLRAGRYWLKLVTEHHLVAGLRIGLRRRPLCCWLQ